MSKNVIIVLAILSIIAVLLFGINVGKRIGNPEEKSVAELVTPSPTPSLTPTPILKPAINPIDKTSTTSSEIIQNQGVSTYTDKTCGFTFSYPGNYLEQKAVNQQSIIFTDPDDPGKAIAATCARGIPRPPVSAENIESVLLNGEPATLYHDQDQDGNPRDEIIAKHPTTGMEIIIAGYGNTFQEVISSFTFI